MNYKLNYQKLIEYRKTNILNENYEIHHIVPKSLGGSNSKENLIRLSFREHFLAHYLLWKMTDGKEHLKMAHAFKFMSKDFKISSRCYQRLKEELSKKVICLQTLQVFNSVTDTINWLSSKINEDTISIKRNLNLVLRKKRKSIQGYAFEFYDSNKQYEKIELIPNKCFKDSSKKIICLQTLRIFENARLAEKETGINFRNISAACTRESSTHGYDFRFYDISKEYKQEPMKSIHIQTNQKIKCVETNAVFNSMNELAKSIGTSRTNIRRYILSERPYKDLHYVFFES